MPPRKAPVTAAKSEPAPSRLIKELAFYRKYHYNPWNVFIHVVCIPIILLSSSFSMTYLRLPPGVISEYVGAEYAYLAPYINLGTIFMIPYGLFYVYLDLPFGLPTAIALWATTIRFSSWGLALGTYGLKCAGGFWTVAWILQFLGHGVFEKRAPALLDSLLQALVLAPLFVVFDVAHFLGLRKGVMNRVDSIVLPEIEQFHTEPVVEKPKRTRVSRAKVAEETENADAAVLNGSKTTTTRKRVTRTKKTVAEPEEVPAPAKRVTRARKAAAAEEVPSTTTTTRRSRKA